MTISKLNPIYPASPDTYLKNSSDAESALARLAHVNAVISKLGEVIDAGGLGTAVTPVVRTNNPILIANSSNANIDALDAAIGANLTPVVRTNNQLVSDTTIVVKLAALDAAIGVNAGSFAYINNAASVTSNLSTLDLVAYLINQRDEHTVSPTYIVKHKLMALGTYDFATHGTSDAAIDITTVDVLPDNAILTDVYVDITTDINSTSGTTTMAFQIEQGGGTAITTAGSIVADNTNIGVLKESTITFPIKLTEASKLQVLFNTNDILAGVATVYIEYIVGL